MRPNIYDLILNRTYGELERNYGFVAGSAKVGDPKLKSDVERVVAKIHRHLLAGPTLLQILATIMRKA